ncbi:MULTISPECIES: restriction endonuclease subunit S [unclassified Empedobacter]|uniref:restriction endonuclease subunit S n=1 Tax=unclassified Empedobacter TaxID=2643773 RepID=UPI0025BD9CF7|nr:MULTISPECIES: restriction endonuclease subunit S [unclassified Empedobacter]
MSKLEELLQGVDVKWLPLGKISEIKTGKGVTKKDCLPSGIYPIISGGVNPMGYIDSFNRKENTVTISRVGANAGFVNFITKKFYLNDKCFSILQKEIYINKIESKYLYYFLKSVEEKIIELQSEGGVPTINTVKVSGIKLPIPCPDNPEKSLEIQQEIVRVLDELTSLTNQLTTELETERQNRKKQFEFFREQLFRFEGKEVEWKTLGEVFDIVAGGDVPKKSLSNVKTEKFQYKVLSNGINEKSLYGWTEIPKISKPSLTISARGTIGWTSIQYLPFYPIVRLLVLTPKIELNLKYAYHYMKFVENNYNVSTSGIPQLTKPMVKDILIPFPSILDLSKSLSEQERIVRLLDQFDATHTAIEEEITKEIKLRTQQYEYYREKLLSFPSLRTT